MKYLQVSEYLNLSKNLSERFRMLRILLVLACFF